MDIELYPITDDIIFHVVKKADISQILKQNFYRAESLDAEGFIHFSFKDQVPWVLETFYKDLKDIAVLGIDKNKLSMDIVIEGGAVPEHSGIIAPQEKGFPHLYGAMETSAIVYIIEISAFVKAVVSDTVKELIEYYQFDRLAVEGTFYKNIYRDEATIDGCSASTAMIGMYTNKPLSISCFHRLTKNEVWHFYGGDPFRLLLLYPDGSHEEVIMGQDIKKGQYIQYVVAKGVWQAGALLKGSEYALFGCTVAPGFKPEDFEGANLDTLRVQYPDCLEDLLYFNINGSHQKMI